LNPHAAFALLFGAIVAYFLTGSLVGVWLERRHGPPPDEGVRSFTVAGWPLVLLWYALDRDRA
jgi:hypothetical protein